MTTAHENFIARLEPEYRIDDLDQRAAKAAGVLADASEAGDWPLVSRAAARITERWAERDALAPAPVWLWQRRAVAIEAALAAAPIAAWAWSDEADDALETVWRLWYYALMRSDGASDGEADVVARDRAANLRVLEQSAAWRGARGGAV